MPQRVELALQSSPPPLTGPQPRSPAGQTSTYSLMSRRDLGTATRGGLQLHQTTASLRSASRSDHAACRAILQDAGPPVLLFSPSAPFLGDSVLLFFIAWLESSSLLDLGLYPGVQEGVP